MARWLMLVAALLSLPAYAGRHGKSAGPINVIIFIGDSNTTGEQDDPQNLTYVPDALTWTWDGQNWTQYVPNTNVGYTPAAGTAGLNYESPDGHWGPETAFIQSFRAAHPTTPLAVYKNTAPGSFASWVTGQSIFFSWDITNGTLFGSATTLLASAMASLKADGYTPTVTLMYVGLGGNDATNSANGAAFQAALTAEVAQMVSTWGFISGKTKIILGRPQTITGPSSSTVRAAVQTVGTSQSYTNWIDTDAAPVNSPSDEHLTAAGQLLIGGLVWGEY